MVSFAATFFACIMGGGGEYPSGDVKDIVVALIHRPILFTGIDILMGLLVAIGMTESTGNHFEKRPELPAADCGELRR